MGRHRTNCLAPRVAAAAAAVRPQAPIIQANKRAKAIAAGTATPTPSEALGLADLLSMMQRSLHRLDSAAEKAATDGAVGALTAASAQLHKGIETIAKLAGIGAQQPPDPANTATIIINLPSTSSLPSSAHTIDAAPIHSDKPLISIVGRATPENVTGDDVVDVEESGPSSVRRPAVQTGSLLARLPQPAPPTNAGVRDLVVPGFRVG